MARTAAACRAPSAVAGTAARAPGRRRSDLDPCLHQYFEQCRGRLALPRRVPRPLERRSPAAGGVRPRRRDQRQCGSAPGRSVLHHQAGRRGHGARAVSRAGHHSTVGGQRAIAQSQRRRRVHSDRIAARRCAGAAMNEINAAMPPSLLLVDDDAVFCEVLARALTRRGFAVQVAHDVEGATVIAERDPPEYAVVDLKMQGSSGLQLVQRLKALDVHTRIVVLTGYASIATAREAIKLGAVHYLSKPADADEIVRAFAHESGNAEMPIDDGRPSIDRLEWEYIQKTLHECGGNVSATARMLGMHRRSLQRKLQKRPVKR